MRRVQVYLGEYLVVEFNFMSPNQLDAWMNAARLAEVVLFRSLFFCESKAWEAKVASLA